MLIHSYKKTFVGTSKTDYVDAFAIAAFARVGKITSSPWRGSQFLALQCLTKHRLHLAKSLTSESPTSSVLTDFLSTDEIADMPLEKLVDFVCDKGKNVSLILKNCCTTQKGRS